MKRDQRDRNRNVRGQDSDETIAPPLMPLIDVAFLVLIFFMALPMRRLDGKLSAHMPTDRGLSAVPAEAPQRPVVIQILSRAAGTRFRLGDHTSATAAGLRPVVLQLGPKTLFEIHGSPGVAWQDVLSMVDELTGLKVTNVQFHGARVPLSMLRAMPLPPPHTR